MKKIEDIFTNLCSTKSDINEHLPTLYFYAKKCNHITEMGVRDCVSSWALILSNPKKMISYDILYTKGINDLENISKEYNINFEFRKQDVLNIEIENTDLLFIDTYHSYKQLSRELKLHAKNVNKYIILHDTVTFGHKDENLYESVNEEIKNENSQKFGLIPAINDFLNGEFGKGWFILEFFSNNNGLTVLSKI